MIIAFFKLALFAIFITFVVLAFKDFTAAPYSAAFVLLIFIGFSVYDKKFEHKYRQSIIIKKINETELANLNKSYQPSNKKHSTFRSGSQFIDPKHDYSFDLDIFEDGSIFQHINRTASIEGEEKLKERLLNIERDESKIAEATEAIKELSEKIWTRQTLTALGFEKQISLHDLLERSKNTDNSKISKPFIIFSYISVTITMACLILYLFKIVPSTLPFIMFMFQLTVSIILRTKINSVYDKINKTSANVAGYTEIASIITSKPLQSAALIKITENLTYMGREIKKLRRILNEFDQRNNGLIYIAINGFLLRDIFSAKKTQEWFIKNKNNIPVWLENTAEFDALSSFATFTFNNPDFIFPEIGGDSIMETENMCHPLIPKEKRVGNDIRIQNKGIFFIITGANMAGKSTFIRSVGISMILASCGLPVCAARFKFRPVPIFTSMRTSDKLLESSSYFQAELARLKTLKEKTEANDITLILLDEILKGTNSDDKLKGSQMVLINLVKMNAAGLLSTHDVALNTLENEMPENFKNYSFDFEVSSTGELIFDYKLHKGVSRNMNAGILLKRIFPE